MDGTINRAVSETTSETNITAIGQTAQRAIESAMRRAARIDRTADLLRSIGRTDAALRLASRAAEIRAVAA